MYLDTADLWLPLIVVSHHENDAEWSNYGSLKYPYIGATAAKSYQFVKPNWYHIQMLSGEIVAIS